jgi:hypothetical protein
VDPSGPVTQHAKAKARPGRAPFERDIQPVARVQEPSSARPANPAFRRQGVMDRDVPGIEQPPARLDGAQREVELLPGEKEPRVIAADLIPGRATDGVAGANEGRAVEAPGREGPQRLGIAPGASSSPLPSPFMMRKPTAARSGRRSSTATARAAVVASAKTASLSSAMMIRPRPSAEARLRPSATPRLPPAETSSASSRSATRAERRRQVSGADPWSSRTMRRVRPT